MSNHEIIKEIMDNEELRAKFEKAQTEEEFNALCKEYSLANFEEKELGEEELDDVSGGGIVALWAIWQVMKQDDRFIDAMNRAAIEVGPVVKHKRQVTEKPQKRYK